MIGDAHRFANRTDPLTIKVTWTPEQRADGLYLREVWDGLPGCTIFGPIPPDFDINAVIDERKRMLQYVANQQLDRAMKLAAEVLAPYTFEVVADQAGIKSAPPQETAPKTGGPVAEGGAEPPSFDRCVTYIRTTLLCDGLSEAEDSATQIAKIHGYDAGKMLAEAKRQVGDSPRGEN